MDVSNPIASPESARVLEFTVPVDRAGIVIGSGGKNIHEVERLTNTSIKMERTLGKSSGNVKGIIYGSKENKEKAILMILNRLKDRESQHTAKTEIMEIPDDKVGIVIGKGGKTISAIKSCSGVLDIKIDKKPEGLEALLCHSQKCIITGSEETIERAKELVCLAMAGGDIVFSATLAAVVTRLAKTFGIQINNEEV